MISNCGHDERGRYSGGKAGDQYGTEWAVIPWYQRPWNHVLRYTDIRVAKRIADLARAAANNNHIGYDQGERTTFWKYLQRHNYNPAEITELCEADCSAGVAAIVKSVGKLEQLPRLAEISPYLYTGNIRNALINAGFRDLTDAAYTGSPDMLYPGDILLYENHHVAINLDYGAKVLGQESVEHYPQWIHTGNRWYYRVSPTENAHGWRLINHHWYFFDGSGTMMTGWQNINGERYYLATKADSEDYEGACFCTDHRGVQRIWFVG